MERTDVKNNHTEEYSTGQIRCIEKSDPEYPQIMKQYASMPAKLYVKGRLPDPKRRTVAVIGARMCSPYGRMQAFRYAKALSVAGVQIISGMALGIDSEGHKGHWKERCLHLRCLEVVLMYAIRNLTENSMRGSYGKMVGSSVNVHWVQDLFPGISRRETGSLVLCQTRFW